MSKLTLTAEPGKHELVMTRVFDAPRDLVFKTYTDPALVPRWWGPEGMTTIVDAMDVRKGGIWRYVQHNAEGNEYAFNGVYHEVLAPERLIYTFEFEPMPGRVVLETITFEEQADGTTRLIDTGVFQSVEDRDAMINQYGDGSRRCRDHGSSRRAAESGGRDGYSRGIIRHRRFLEGSARR